MKKVAVLLATYNPDMKYFIEQIKSINAQTYPEITIIVRDDCSKSESFSEINTVLTENLRKFPFLLYQNEYNLGSTKTFELLTGQAESDYFAYCDQDDIWEPEKICKLVNLIERENSVLVYSDLSVIDGQGILINKSMRDTRRRLKHLAGEGLFNYFVRRNSVTGCTMLIKADLAKASIPFPLGYIHDHWLALRSSLVGMISYVPEPLVRYRIHGNNQIGNKKLSGVSSKEDYIQRLVAEKEKYQYILDHIKVSKEEEKLLSYLVSWVDARIAFFSNKGLRSSIKFFMGLREDLMLFVFELVFKIVPKRFSNFFLNKVRSSSY